MWFLGWNGFIQIPVILICRASSFCKSEIVFPSNSPRFALLPLSDGYDSHSVYAFDCLGFLIEMELYFIHVVECDRTFLKGNSVVVYAYAIFSYLLSANEHWFFFILLLLWFLSEQQRSVCCNEVILKQSIQGQACSLISYLNLWFSKWVSITWCFYIYKNLNKL